MLLMMDREYFTRQAAAPTVYRFLAPRLGKEDRVRPDSLALSRQPGLPCTRSAPADVEEL
jgi:hypothetical protein